MIYMTNLDLGEENKIQNPEKIPKNINYWKEVNKELNNILKNLSGVVLLTHNSIEFTNIIDILNKIRKDKFLDILYVSLVRSYGYMKKALIQKPLEQKRLFVIDCVSGFAFPPEDKVDNCLYHSPPENLYEMKEIIKFGIEKANPDIVIIDSLSQFVNFSHPTSQELEDLYIFLKTVKQDTLNVVQKTFILLYDSKLGVMHRLPKSYTDLILKVEVT